jgi:hypothetical protein
MFMQPIALSCYQIVWMQSVLCDADGSCFLFFFFSFFFFFAGIDNSQVHHHLRESMKMRRLVKNGRGSKVKGHHATQSDTHIFTHHTIYSLRCIARISNEHEDVRSVLEDPQSFPTRRLHPWRMALPIETILRHCALYAKQPNTGAKF